MRYLPSWLWVRQHRLAAFDERLHRARRPNPALPPLETPGNRPLLSGGAPGLDETYGRMSLSFEVNQGQASPGIDFLARGGGYAIALTSSGASLTLNQSAGTDPGTAPPPAAEVQMQLVGASQGMAAHGLDLQP